MVSGFTKFKERFQSFEHQYVIIGGTACDLKQGYQFQGRPYCFQAGDIG